MKVLVAEDDVFFRRLLEGILASDYEIVLAQDGVEAWAALQPADAPRLAILDWVMPGMSGPQVCRKVRQSPSLSSMYLMILTAKNSSPDVVSGLRAGADDYVTKPFEPEELRARVRVGERILRLQDELEHHVTALRDALAREKLMQALLPVCPHCKRVRTDSEYWREVAAYVNQHPGLRCNPETCPDCFSKIVHSQSELAKGSAGGLP